MATIFGKPVSKVIKHPGALTKKAADAGKSITEYCAQGGLDGHSKKQCFLAKTMRSWNK